VRNARTARPGPGEVRAVVVDIDGTLTDGSRRMSLDAVAALRRVDDSGVPVMLASGNVLPIAYAVSTYMGFSGPIVAENGGVVCHRQRVWVLGDGSEPRRAYEHLSGIMPVERLFTDKWRETEVGLKETVDASAVREALEGFDVDVQSTGWAIHVMRKGVDKFAGIVKGCEVLGVPVDSVAAIGDSDNDTAMLGGCGWGIATANASDPTKAAASHVTDGSHGDGVLQALTWLGLA
jgi:hypothetical protein